MWLNIKPVLCKIDYWVGEMFLDSAGKIDDYILLQ
jgi:hypothetical protein